MAAETSSQFPNFDGDFGKLFSELVSMGSSSKYDQYEPTSEEITVSASDYDNLKAEFDQYRKRVQNNLETEKKLLKRKLMGDFLEGFVVFMVNVFKGKKAADGNLSDEDYLILKKMNDYLDGMGVVPMEDPTGKPFDYATMDAVYTDTVNERGYPKGTVTKVVYNGFTMDGEVLLHQRVAVAG